MQKHAIAVTDERGNAVETYTVTVYQAGTQTLATIYSDDGVTTKANPFSVNAPDGESFFYAPNGRYDYDITNGPAGMDDEAVEDVVLFDVADLSKSDIPGITFDGNDIDLTGSADHDLLAYDAASNTYIPMTALEAELDTTFARVNARTDGWFWVRRGSPDPDPVAAFTQQGAGHIVDFRQGTGDGSVVAHITNSGGADFAGDVIIGGNLTVNGTTTTVNSTEVEIGDNIIILNSGETGTPSQDAGIEVERGTSSNVQLIWDESADRWTWEDAAGAYHTIPGLDVAETVAATWDFTGITVGGTPVVLESRTITAGAGLQGGGDLSANRTLLLDINGLTAEATVDGASDYVVMYDASIGAHRKVLAQDLADSGGNGLTTGDLYQNGGTIPEVGVVATWTATQQFDSNIKLNDPATGNPNLFFEDSGSTRGILFWNRSPNEIELRSYATDGTSVQSQFILGNNEIKALNPLYENGTRVATLGANTFMGVQTLNEDLDFGNSSRKVQWRNGNAGTFGDFDFPELSSDFGIFRFFRATNTTGNKELRIHKGDGSTAITAQIFADDGLGDFGKLKVGGGATIKEVASVTKSVGSTSVNAHSSVNYSDVTVSGASLGDNVIVADADGSAETRLVFFGRVVSANTVRPWVTNTSTTNLTATTNSLRITVIRF